MVGSKERKGGREERARRRSKTQLASRCYFGCSAGSVGGGPTAARLLPVWALVLSE